MRRLIAPAVALLLLATLPPGTANALAPQPEAAPTTACS